MTFRSHLGTSLSPGREPVRVLLALLSSPPSAPRRRLGNPAVPLMPSLQAMREQSRRVGKTRFRPREPARDSQTHSYYYGTRDYYYDFERQPALADCSTNSLDLRKGTWIVRLPHPRWLSLHGFFFLFLAGNLRHPGPCYCTRPG